MKNLTQLKKQLLQKKQQRGLTLVEVGLAVAISAVIVIGVLYMYSSTATSSSVYQFNNDMTSIRSAVSTYVQTNSATPDGLSTLISNGYLTLGSSSDGKGADPWGGDYGFKDNGDGTYTLTASNVTGSACTRLATQWSHMGSSVTSASCASGAFTATIDF